MVMPKKGNSCFSLNPYPEYCTIFMVMESLTNFKARNVLCGLLGQTEGGMQSQQVA